MTTLLIGSFLGALLAGALSDFVGRKVTVLVGTSCCLVGGVLQTGAFFIWLVSEAYKCITCNLLLPTQSHVRSLIIPC